MSTLTSQHAVAAQSMEDQSQQLISVVSIFKLPDRPDLIKDTMPSHRPAQSAVAPEVSAMPSAAPKLEPNIRVKPANLVQEKPARSVAFATSDSDRETF